MLLNNSERNYERNIRRIRFKVRALKFLQVQDEHQFENRL